MIDFKLAKLRWSQQKAQAKGRLDINGNLIHWNLTFDQWIQLWIDSGHWNERGRGSGQYCMSRVGDLGNYEVGNVEIKTMNENVIEGSLGRKIPSRGRTGPRGPMSQETRNAISRARQGQVNNRTGLNKKDLKEKEICV